MNMYTDRVSCFNLLDSIALADNKYIYKVLPLSVKCCVSI